MLNKLINIIISIFLLLLLLLYRQYSLWLLATVSIGIATRNSRNDTVPYATFARRRAVTNLRSSRCHLAVAVSRVKFVSGEVRRFARAKMHFSTILCLVLAAAATAQYTEEEAVLVLTKENFDDAVRDFKYLLVEFCESVIATYG